MTSLYFLSLQPMEEIFFFSWIRTDIERVETFLRTLQEYLGTEIVQVASAEAVVSTRQMQAAVFHAIASEKTGFAKVRRIGLRILTYLAAERQIEEVIKKVGIGTGVGVKAVILGATHNPEVVSNGFEELLKDEEISALPEPPLRRCEVGLQIFSKLYGIPQSHLMLRKYGSRSLEDVLIEKMALLSLEL